MNDDAPLGRPERGSGETTPAPAGARARMRRRALAVVLGVVAAVLVVVVVVTLVGGDTQETGPDRAPRVPEAGVPDGWVTYAQGHAAISVPGDWGFDETRCGDPTRDTVMVGDILPPACPWRNPDAVSAVRLSTISETTRMPDRAGLQRVDDGVFARVYPCRVFEDRSAPACIAHLWVPGESAFLEVTSPTRAETQRLLDTVRVESDYVGVPVVPGGGTDSRAGTDRYLRQLRDVGLTPEVRHVEDSGMAPGLTRRTDPGWLRAVAVGTTVTVDVSAG